MSAEIVIGAAEQRNRNADSSIPDDLASAADRLAVASRRLARLAQAADSGAIAADALRARRLAGMSALLADAARADLAALDAAPRRCTCATCAPWGAEPWVDLRDVPPAVRRG